MTDDEMMKSGAFGDLKEEMKALEEELMKTSALIRIYMWNMM